MSDINRLLGVNKLQSFCNLQDNHKTNENRSKNSNLLTTDICISALPHQPYYKQLNFNCNVSNYKH